MVSIPSIRRRTSIDPPTFPLYTYNLLGLVHLKINHQTNATKYPRTHSNMGSNVFMDSRPGIGHPMVIIRCLSHIRSVSEYRKTKRVKKKVPKIIKMDQFFWLGII